MATFLLTEGGDAILTEDDLEILVESTYIIDVDGRDGIGVAQPQSGTDFPIVQPSEDIRYLLADASLTFNQPSDYAAVPTYQLPFHVYWLSGFGDQPANPVIPANGSLSVSQSGSLADYHPPVTHPHDIVIVDAASRVVFDSTASDVQYAARNWGSRLRVVTWETAEQTVVVSYHTAWNIAGTPTPRSYPSNFFPEAAVLDERVVIRQSKHVKSLTAILDRVRGSGIEFHAGYNMALATAPASTITGRRRTTRVTLNATAGAGLGVFPDCTVEPLQIRTINNVQPTDAGHFFLAATDCYWWRQPTRLLDTDPRLTYPEVALFPGNVPTPNLPHATAGTTKSAPGWPVGDNPRYAHLQIGNDCQPCCDCGDYVETAEFMNQVRHKYQRLGQRFEGTRDLYHVNRSKWLENRTCILQRPVRLQLIPQQCPFIDVVLQVCNQTGVCMDDIELRASFFASPGSPVGEVLPGFTFVTCPKYTDTSSNRTTPAVVTGTWPEFHCDLPKVGVGHSAHVRFRLTFANCGMALAQPIRVSGALIALVGGDTLTVLDADGHNITATGSDEQTLRCPGEDHSGNWLSCTCGE